MILTNRNLAICKDCLDCVCFHGCRHFKKPTLPVFQKAKGLPEGQRQLEWARTNPHKVKAQKQFRASIDRRAEKCSHCGNKRNVIGHYPDYDRPLDVIWLCQSCHKRFHNLQLKWVGP